MKKLIARLGEPSTFAGLGVIASAVAHGRGTGDWGPFWASAVPALVALLRPEGAAVAAAVPAAVPVLKAADAVLQYAPQIARAVEGEAKP